VLAAVLVATAADPWSRHSRCRTPQRRRQRPGPPQSSRVAAVRWWRSTSCTSVFV